MTSPHLLTQRDLIARLRDDLGIHVGSYTIHDWIRAGMPTSPACGKKPRFVWVQVRAWVLSQREAHPVVQGARDRAFKRRMKSVS